MTHSIKIEMNWIEFHFCHEIYCNLTNDYSVVGYVTIWIILLKGKTLNSMHLKLYLSEIYVLIWGIYINSMYWNSNELCMLWMKLQKFDCNFELKSIQLNVI